MNNKITYPPDMLPTAEDGEVFVENDDGSFRRHGMKRLILRRGWLAKNINAAVKTSRALAEAMKKGNA